MALMVKNPPANARDVRDTVLVPGLGRAPGGDMEDHSSILPWRIQSCGQRSLVGYNSQGHKELDTTRATWHACRLGEGPIWAECFSVRGDGGGRDGSEYDIMETSFWIY